MKLIFAQGNSEAKYDNTRHNIGFRVLDEFASSLNLQWSNKTKFDAHIAETTIGSEKVILAKPTTYYNETGQSARKIVDFYTLDSATDVLVIHDELALPIGTVRTRKQGSDAGNNGVKSLNNHLGQDYHRIRIGISNDLRDRTDDAEFVLSKFTVDEKTQLNETIIPQTTELINQFLQGTLPITSHTL